MKIKNETGKDFESIDSNAKPMEGWGLESRQDPQAGKVVPRLWLAGNQRRFEEAGAGRPGQPARRGCYTIAMCVIPNLADSNQFKPVEGVWAGGRGTGAARLKAGLRTRNVRKE